MSTTIEPLTEPVASAEPSSAASSSAAPSSAEPSSGGPSSAAPSSVEDGTLRERKKRQTRKTIHDVALRLVREHGLAGVTVDEICAEADVSQRTFFNYFKSKSAAAIGLAELRITDDERDTFLSGPRPDLVDDLCRLIASAVDQPVDREKVRELVNERPELTATLLQGMAELQKVVVSLAEQRAGTALGRAAVSLVMASLFDAMHPTEARSNLAFEDRLRASVDAVVELIGGLSA